MFERITKTKTLSRAEMRERVRDSLEQTGWKREMEPAIPDRMTLLEGTEFNEASRQVERGMLNVLEWLRLRRPELFGRKEADPEWRAEMAAAAFLHDIGKTGPADASPEAQGAIVKLFAAEKIGNPLEQAIVEAVYNNFPAEEAQTLLENITSTGIPPQMTMREFWDEHPFWGKDILEKHPRGTTERMRLIVASHHADRGKNPYGLPEVEIPVEARMMGALEDYSDLAAGRTLMAVDKYQAAVERGKLTHEKAVGYLRDSFQGKFERDEILRLIMQAIDELGAKDKLFE